MKTQLHLTLEKMCRILRKGEGHWYLTGRPTFYIPEIGSVPTKRVIFAAFVRAIPENMEVRAGCGVRQCVAPGHQVLVPSRAVSARPLSLDVHLEALDSRNSETVRRLVDESQILRPPPGVSLAALAMAKTMTKSGASIGGIVQATGLPIPEVMRVRGGRYDRCLLRARKDEKKESGVGVLEESFPDVFDEPSPPVAAPAIEEVYPSGVVEDDEEFGEEDAAWIRSVGRG